MSTTLLSRITPFSMPPQTSTTTTTTYHYHHYHLHTSTPHTLPKPPYPSPFPIPRYCMYTVLHAPYIQPPTSLIPSLFLASAPKSTIPHHLSPSPSQTSPPPHIPRHLSPSGEISSPSHLSTACATPASTYSPHDVERISVAPSHEIPPRPLARRRSSQQPQALLLLPLPLDDENGDLRLQTRCGHRASTGLGRRKETEQ